MDHRINVSPNDKFFVGIFKKENAYEIYVMHTLDAIEKTHHLVYYRSFPEAILACGYRIILQQMSVSSIKKMIRKVNPEEKNLLY